MDNPDDRCTKLDIGQLRVADSFRYTEVVQLCFPPKANMRGCSQHYNGFCQTCQGRGPNLNCALLLE